MAKSKKKEIEYNSVIYNTTVEDVMHDSMMPYSENVILDRAIPRVEDGLKPVQRRVLYSMFEMGVTPDKPYKKSARIVGDCLGKYHPHGDSSVYGAMVRMAQPFAMRMKLVDGHGNFGSVDGDSPAAMRYTEARLSPLALELLRDLDKDTVSWNPNFDDTLEEPNMLPGRFPNLLVNGASGIAVGLATNIPPHNMGETIDAVVAMIDNPKITLQELLKIVKGPDFPTGAFIIPVDSLESIYETGKGKIKIRSRLHVEDDDYGKKNIVITEMPYQLSKADLLMKIAELRDKDKDVLSGINEVVDESDKNGMRAVIKCRKDTDINKIVKYLYKKTNLEMGYSINMVAIANGKPEQLGLIDILKYYIEYQRDVIVKRTTFDLKAAKHRAEIIKGLLIALDNIDEVIKIIKGSATTAKAKEALRQRFDLSDEQAQAIVDMRLKALTHLEVDKLQAEYQELLKKIDEYTKILGSQKRQYGVVKKEILEIKDRNESPRMSVIINNDDGEDVDVPTAEEMVEYREGVLVTNKEGTIRFMSPKAYALATKDMTKYGENELPKQVLTVNNKGCLLGFTDKGNCVRIDVTNIPEKKFKDKGTTIGQLCQDVAAGEKLVNVQFYNSTPVGELVFFTKEGMVKRTDVSEFTQGRAYSQAIILGDKDELINVTMLKEDAYAIQVTKDGLVIMYSPEEISLQGKKAGGVRGVKLNPKDYVVFSTIHEDEGELVIASNTGYVKRVIIAVLDPTSRYTKGVKIMDLDKSKICYVSTVKMPYDIAVVSGEETTIINTEDVRIDTRTTKGKCMFKNGIKYISQVTNQL